jgi:hypothetical protein
VQGPHPAHPQRHVFHWFEMCDAVQDENYVIDGVRVSNFVLPLYFTSSEERGGRNDFLGSGTLHSFSVNPGGYIGFYDPRRGRTGNYASNARAKERLSVKEQLHTGRGQLRHRRFTK